jgi:hypothetical protein
MRSTGFYETTWLCPTRRNSTRTPPPDGRRQPKHFVFERVDRHRFTLPGLRTCDFLGTPTRTSTRPPDKMVPAVPQISLGPARTGLRLLAMFQVFAQLADLVLDAA